MIFKQIIIYTKINSYTSIYMKKRIIIFSVFFNVINPTSSSKQSESYILMSNISGTFEGRTYNHISFNPGTSFTVYQITNKKNDPKGFQVSLSLEKNELDPYIISMQVIPWDEIDSLRFENTTQDNSSLSSSKGSTVTRTTYNHHDSIKKEIKSSLLPIEIIFSNQQKPLNFLIEKNKEITMYDKELKIKCTMKMNQLTSPLLITEREVNQIKNTSDIILQKKN